MSVKEFLTEDRLLAVFQQFDTKGTGKIKIEDVAQAMEKFGLSDRISDQDLEQIMKKHDTNNNGEIDFKEF